MTERWRLIKPPPPKEEAEGRRESDPISLQHLELYDIQADPGQRINLADRHPDTVAELLRQYEAWWDDVSPKFDDYNDIVIGSDRENPAVVHGHDAHRKGARQVWVIEAERAGEYAFRAFRWPLESGKKILESREGTAIAAPAEARLRVGNVDRSSPVSPEMTAAEFSLHLTAGRTCLEAWFGPEKSEKPWLAAAVEIKRIAPADPGEAGRYRATDPDALLR